MNMQKIMLEAMTANDKAIIREANVDFDRLKQCVFPMDGVQDIETQVIKDKVAKNEPITFEWALQEYYKNSDKDYHRKFLQDLAKGLLKEKTDESMFFSHEDAGSLDKYQTMYPVLSKLKEGPQVFKWFNKLLGTELGKTALSSTETTFDESGKAHVRPLDNDRAIRDTYEKYFGVAEEHLETIYKFVLRGSSLSRDGVLYAAYIGYMFHTFENARKVEGEATDDDSKKVKMNELLDMPAHTIAKNAAEKLPTSSTGSLTNKHSYYNLRQRSLRTIDPFRINGSNLSEIYIYPQFTIDVLALTPSTADSFIKVLKDCGYSTRADCFADLEGEGDNKILDMTSKELIAILKDPNVIQGCLDAGLNDIFKKWGSSWVSETGESSLDELLLAKPPEQNSDKRYVQVVPVAKGESLRQANTDREMTGYDMIAESNKDMVIGEGDVVKDPDAEVGGERISDENVKAISNAFEEAYNELFGTANAKNLKLKSAVKLKDLIVSKLQALNANHELTVNIVPNIQRLRFGSAREFIAKFWRVVKGLNPSAPSRIVYDTFDGKHHDMAITDGIYETLDNTDFENVISRKVSTGGHTYFISIPRGNAFVAMQENDDDTIVRTENPNTYCMGLVRDGNTMRYSSVSDLMNSPIGKYGTAVVKYHKVGRVKFSTDEANEAYAKVLTALINMKNKKQDWNPGPVEGMAGRKGAIRVLQTVIASEYQDPTEQHEIIQPFLGNVSMSVESYDKQSGKFVFESTSSVGGTLIRHLSDMYNLDKTVEDYSEWDVTNILKVVSPSSKWDLTDWNFRNVLRADAALNGTSSEFADDATVGETPVDNGSDADSTWIGGGKYSDDAQTYPTNDEGEATFDGESDAEVGGEGIGNENAKAIRNAFDAAYEKLFGADADARNLTLEDGRRLKDGIVRKLHEMRANNMLSLNIIPAVQSIEYTSFKDFVNKFWAVADKAVGEEPDLSDNSIRMEAFANDKGVVSDELEPAVKKCLYDFVRKGGYDDTDKKLIPEMGSLMMRYATSSAFENNGLSTSCNRENLVSTFNQNFDKDWQMKMDAVAKLQNAASGEDVDMELNKFKVNVAKRDADLYSAIQEKIDADPDYVSRVADIVAQNANAIVNDLNGVSLDEAAQKVPYVPFDRKAAKWFNDAGNTLIDFCLYGTEDNTNQSLTKLNTAFGAEGINAMMYRLYKSVPKSCLSIDYGTDSNGIARLDTKTVRELWANELQMLESHYNKNGLRDTLARKGNINFADLEQKIKKTYENGTVGKLFACETGVTSPFTYNGAPLNLNAVKSYFDALMAFAKSYNDIGASTGPNRTIEKQERTQNTLNNELQKQKVLENKYFDSLYTEFTRVYNGLQSNELSPTDESVKQTIAKVLKQVVANPMNVLVNNNARLISAYAYYEELIKAENRSVYQSRKSLGFGVGVDDESEKNLGKQSSLTGRNEVIDKTVSPVELALATVHTEELRKQMNALRKQISVDTAEEDYQKYLSEVGSGNRAVKYANDTELNVANIENLDADGRAKAMLDRFDNIKDDYKLFCNYKLDANGTKPANIAKMVEYRKNELIMLLYKTACDIVDARSKLPRDAKTFRDKLAAQGEYVKYGSAEIIPQHLMTKFANLTAELEIADFSAYMDFIGKIKASAAASNVKTPGDTDKGPSSNNDPTQSALNIMRGKEQFAKNRTDELIDDIISDKPIDMDAAHKLITDMGKKGSRTTGTDITLTGTLNVIQNDAGGDMIITTNVRLNENDKLVITVGNEVYPRVVKSVDAQQYVGTDNKQHTLYKYTIASIYGLAPSKKDIPFQRFQSANTLSGFDFGGETLNAVLAKLDEWHEQYDGLGKGGIPADVKQKLHILKALYEGCSGSLLMKSIVSYCVWRASNYNGEFAPQRTLRRVGGYMSDPLMKKYFDTIALDLEELGPDGIKKDPEKYAEILDILPDDFISTAQQFHYDLVTPENVRKGGHETAANITIASLDMDATNTLKLIVNTLAKWSGYVGADDVTRFLSNQKGYGRINLSAEDATKLLDMVSPTGGYKSVLDDILKEHNWDIAKPLLESYKRTTSTPTFDDAIQYLRDNYVTKRVGGVEVKNRDAFANYIKTNCQFNVKQALNIA